MPDAPHITADYQTLLNHLKAGMDKYMPEGTEKAYPVKELLGLVEPEGEDEQLELLRMMRAHLEEKESTTETAVSLLELKPNFFGLGFNLNEAFNRLLGKKKQKWRQDR